MIWSAYYAIEPWGHEAKFASMQIVSNLKSGNWRHFMPEEFQTADNPSEMSAEERARKDSGIGRAFENMARSLSNK